MLYLDSVSLIVSRFPFFTENLVICCYQIAEFFFTRYLITGAFPGLRPCNFGLLTDFTTSVFRDASKNAVLAPILLFSKNFDEVVHEKCLRVHRLMRKLLRPRNLVEFLQPFWQITQRASPCFVDVLIFRFVVGFFGIS